MDKESDVIKHQMEHTRSALTDKLEALEHQVTDTVTGAAETVEKEIGRASCRERV